MTRIADWLMQSAVHGAPAERADWARAMQAEFTVKEHGRLGWALGCWLAVTGWRVRGEVGYLAVLLATTAFLHVVWPMASVYLDITIRSWAPRESFYVLGMVGPALACLALGAYRPRNVVLTVLILRVLEMAFTLWVLANMGHPFHSQADVFQHLHIMDLPFALGYSIWIVTDLAFAFSGAALRRSIAKAA